jgi:hypothetical protein
MSAAKRTGRPACSGRANNDWGEIDASRHEIGALGAIAILTLPATSPAAEPRGVTATEIKIGQTMPYSGPVSAFGALGKGEVGGVGSLACTSLNAMSRRAAC